MMKYTEEHIAGSENESFYFITPSQFDTLLLFHRYFRLSYKFEKKTIGSDLKLIRYRMAVTMKKKKANSAQ